MKPELIDDSDNAIGPLTDEMIGESLAYRENAAQDVTADRGPVPEQADTETDWRDFISLKGYQLIARWETGGKSYYERVIKERPIWPGFASGITIGCGFDLGYHRRDELLGEWRNRLGRADLERLADVSGFRTTAPDREQKVEQARSFVTILSDIRIPWQLALAHFEQIKLPKLIKLLYASLPGVETLHPHCRAALLSLMFNRGASFRNSGDRFAEMRQIAEVLGAAENRDLNQIPSLLRAMKRIWGPQSSLSRRREEEADLFELGLRERESLRASPRTPEATGGGALEIAQGPERHDAVDAEQSDDADEAEVIEMLARSRARLESTALALSDVRWSASDDEQPDYRHLDRALSGQTFELTPTDLEALISSNEYSPLPGLVLFALRGAALAGGVRINEPSIVVTDQRPDHRNFRCVIGCFDRVNHRLSAFPASTVPNAAYVLKCHVMAQSSVPITGLTGNILPTGCYTYTVGTHKKGQRGEIPNVLRLSTSSTGASEVVVLRSLTDVVYDRLDRFVNATPADNIHPGQLSNGFSSAGCLTVPGRYANGEHSGVWQEFRAAIGLDQANPGDRYSMMLFTGLDAANAARVRNGGMDTGQLQRLRHGSVGNRVAALQRALGLPTDASQKLGPVTRQALVLRQSKALGWADGIHSPEMDSLLKMNVYNEF